MNAPGQGPPKSKTPWWVVLLLLGGGMIVLGILAIGGIVWWVSENKDRILAEGKEAMDEAQSFGATHEQTACVPEAMKKVASCKAVMCRVKLKVFLQTCLASATPSPALCAGVPKSSEIVATSRWVISACQKYGKGTDQGCTTMMQAVPEACAMRDISQPNATP